MQTRLAGREHADDGVDKLVFRRAELRESSAAFFKVFSLKVFRVC
jgi:hypothetical protein